jgi:hypothetical protein
VSAAVPTAATKRNTTYSINTLVFALAAVSIGDESDWIINIALTLFTISMALVATAAILLAIKRLRAISGLDVRFWGRGSDSNLRGRL